ncbi:MAG: DNA polymerase III subunit delta [Gammaproteobacteria bacterium]|nr:DNA polymerase III subunit delta [Gammaproteobacteria bacterium]
MTQLAYINIISTDEPLLSMEACDEIIEQAKKEGMESRDIIDASDKTNWDEVLADNSSLSLFAEKKLLDIRFGKMPTKTAQEALTALVNEADENNLILIRLPKLEKKQKSTKWFQTLTKTAKVIELWPPKAHEFQNWISQRARQQDIQLQKDVIALLAEHTEGNLLAASQVLNKLKLLFDGAIDIEKLKSVSFDNARYSTFSCFDEALVGQGERAVRMLKKFRQEGAQPISLLTLLTREAEWCQQVAVAKQKGDNPYTILNAPYLWDSRKKMIIAASDRLPLAMWQKLLIRCAHLDRMIKGQETGDVWRELELCLWLLSGKSIWRAAS